MKHLVVSAFAAVLLCACGQPDYRYEHTFFIDNRSETVINIYSAEDVLLFTVASGQKREVFSKSFKCHQNAKNVDYFPDPNQMINWLETNKVKAGETLLTGGFWQKRFWQVDSGMYYSDYTIVVTAEVVAELTPPPPEPEPEPEGPAE